MKKNPAQFLTRISLIYTDSIRGNLCNSCLKFLDSVRESTDSDKRNFPPRRGGSGRLPDEVLAVADTAATKRWTNLGDMRISGKQINFRVGQHLSTRIA